MQDEREQRGLARAVGADQGDPLTVVHLQGGVFKQCATADGLAQVADGKHKEKVGKGRRPGAKTRAVEVAPILPFDKGERDGFRKGIIMRPPLPRFFLRFRPGFACALLLAAGGLGACDRHSATEVPESYGHGSSHQRNYDNHRIDSHSNLFNGKPSKSLSHPPGSREQNHPGDHRDPKAAPGASASPAQPGRFFPNGS